jgi:hypothetical protein
MRNHNARPARTEPSTLQQVAAEHDLIRELLARMEKAVAIELLLAEIERLEPLLFDHFESEEAPGGLYAQVRERIPGNFSRLEALEHEHGEFLDELRRLEGACRTRVQPPKAIRRNVEALVQRIRAHEASESEFLRDAFMTDLGGRD